MDIDPKTEIRLYQMTGCTDSFLECVTNVSQSVNAVMNLTLKWKLQRLLLHFRMTLCNKTVFMYNNTMK